MLRTLHVDQGFWRATPMSRNILECYNKEACLGGLTGSAEFCALGYEGPCEQYGLSDTNQIRLNLHVCSVRLGIYNGPCR